MTIRLVDKEPIPGGSLKTNRLVLRPTNGADADRAFEIQMNWEVTRMLQTASFPPDRERLGRSFAAHEHEWQAGEAYHFAVELDGMMIGLVGFGGIAAREGHLCYWLDRPAWGQGYGTEAACAVMRFAFDQAGLLKLTAAHAYDDLTSQRLLARLGFSLVDTVARYSRPRRAAISQHRYVQSVY